MDNCTAVLRELKKCRSKGLTQDQAIPLGVFRLAARVKDLRDRGFRIETMMLEGVNQYGHKTRYARYVLKA